MQSSNTHLRNPGARLCVYTMGKTFEVTYIATSQDDANAYMADHPGQSLIDTTIGGLHLIAKDEPLTRR